ncbi:MAG: aspartate dehydrogenase [Eubacteriales bacterium]|nr:aspartate dehydrogenase [Eubacteriales bacterium]
MKKRIRLAVMGTGNLAGILVENLKKPEYDAFELEAVWGRTLSKAEKLTEGTQARPVTELRAMLDRKPDFVLEATAPDCLKETAPQILRAGSSMVILSAGALADSAFREQVTEAGKEGNSRMYVASGAIGGFDFLTTAMLMGDLSVTVRNRKPPAAYENAPFLEGREISQEEAQVLFEGSAREAIRRFPKNVNVAVAAAEATVGSDRARVTVVSDPALVRNTHTIELSGNFGEASLTMGSNPSAKNPGSSEMAAYSVLSLLKRMTQVIVF